MKKANYFKGCWFIKKCAYLEKNSSILLVYKLFSLLNTYKKVVKNFIKKKVVKKIFIKKRAIRYYVFLIRLYGYLISYNFIFILTLIFINLFYKSKG